MNVEEFLARLHGVKRNGPGWSARCPAHEDHDPSLSINECDGKILLHCHTGCTPEAVCAALGIEMRDLFMEPQSKSQIETVYEYTNEKSELLFQVVRFEPKGFRQRRPDGRGGWTWKLGDVRRVVYHLPEVLAALGK